MKTRYEFLYKFLTSYFQSGEIEYQEFIAVFIGEMPEERVFFVNKCWRKLDPKGNGEVNKFDAQKVFRYFKR